MKKGRLFLIPVPLGDSGVDAVIPGPVRDCAKHLLHFVAENAKSARVFLKALPHDTPLQKIDIQELNEHTPIESVRALLDPILKGFDVGLVSEAGCPAVADPGASLVALAHQEGIQVLPLVGPSSILLALMGSGLSGQNFTFLGYLPAKEGSREQKIREMERESKRHLSTQIFIETPYRNKQMMESLLATCAPTTRICVATDLTLPSESILTRSRDAWLERELPEINRRPTVFLLQA